MKHLKHLLKYKFLIMIFVFAFTNLASAQTVSTTDQTFTGADFGLSKEVPINTSDIHSSYGNILTATIRVEYDENILTYTGYTNMHPTIAAQSVNVFPAGGNGVVQFNIEGNNFTPFQWPDGKAWDIQFTYNGGYSALDITLAEFLNYEYTTFNAAVTNGSVDGFADISATDGDWHTTSIWSPPANMGLLTAPGPGHNVSINPGGTVTISADAICNDLTIGASSNGQLTLNSGNLEVLGDFLIESVATGTGSFIQNGTLTVTGTSTVQQYVTGSSYQDIYHLMGIPVNSVESYTTFLNCYLKTYNETTGLYEDVQNDPGPAGNVTLNTPMVGYSVGYAMGGLNKLIDFNGTLLTGNQSIAVTKTVGEGDGWNLVGNPYPSSIDWDHVDWTKTNIAAEVAVWNSIAGNFIYWNGTVGSLTDGIIPPMQGFFVEATDATGTIGVTNGVRTHSSYAFYKSTVNDLLSLKATGANEYFDAVFVNFNSNSTEGFDYDFDGHKLSGLETAPQLFAIIPGHDLSINVLPEITENTGIDLGFTCGISAVYTITADGIESFAISTPIYLEDLKENNVIDLRENPVYDFVYETGDDELRFKLHFNETFGINEITDSKVNIFSLNNIIYVNLSEEISGDIFIYNLMGQEVSRSAISGLNNEIVLNVPNAYYVVKVVSDDTFVAKKVFLK